MTAIILSNVLSPGVLSDVVDTLNFEVFLDHLSF